jgi:hypothetical protein
MYELIIPETIIPPSCTADDIARIYVTRRMPGYELVGIDQRLYTEAIKKINDEHVKRYHELVADGRRPWGTNFIWIVSELDYSVKVFRYGYAPIHAFVRFAREEYIYRAHAA